MDYEYKYKEALERARNLHKDAIDMEESLLSKQCEIIFPELKESWDERIKKDIKRAISVALDYSYFDKETADNCLAWLEKQGEQDNWAEELNNRIKALHKQCLEIIQKYVSP